MTIIIKKPELFAAACRFSAKSEARPYLEAVAIEPAPQGGAFIISTDGHRLFVGYDSEAEFINGPAHNCLFKAEKQKLPVAAFKAKCLVLDGTAAFFCSDPFSLAAYDESGRPLAIDYMQAAQSIGHEWTFPQWRGVLPNPELEAVPSVDYSFNSEYIADFGEIERRLTGKRDVAFKARMTGGNPALVSLGRDDCFGVLMPMRIYDGEAAYDDANALLAHCKQVTGEKAAA